MLEGHHFESKEFLDFFLFFVFLLSRTQILADNFLHPILTRYKSLNGQNIFLILYQFLHKKIPLHQ